MLKNTNRVIYIGACAMILSVKSLTAQVHGIILDSTTSQPIPYVNIFIENENIGTSSDEYGKFKLPVMDMNKRVIFSAVGYETISMASHELTDTIYLINKSIELSEATIMVSKTKVEQTIGSFKKSEIDWYISSVNMPRLLARYFDYRENYTQTPWIKGIKVLTLSNLNQAVFNVRLYSVGDSGKPKDLLHSQNILCYVKKGKRITEIDLSSLNIRFPENGFFIAFESLMIEENKYKFILTMANGKKVESFRYEPGLGCIQAETNEGSWDYYRGRWIKITPNNLSTKSRESAKYSSKYSIPAIELILSN